MKERVVAKAAKKKPINWKAKLFLWAFALLIYFACLSIYLTFIAPQLLELMRWMGAWPGLSLGLFGFFVALIGLPAVLAWKVKKAPFGKLCLGWSILSLGLLVGLAPVGDWFGQRGSFVPALILGPESVVVERVVTNKIGWGDAWKVRPESRPFPERTPEPEAPATPQPSATP